MGRGAFIVFEGLDRCGKSTQSQKLVERLKKDGIPCQLHRFPDRSTSIGQMISSYLTQTAEMEDHAIHLLFSANRWELAPRICELLEKGTTVIVDRYSYSGVVYTAAKKGFSLGWCQQPEVGLPKPDLVLFLNTSARLLAGRADYGGERYESAAFQARVLDNYLLLMEDYWTELDASLTIEATHEQVLSAVRPVMEAARDKPILKLWTRGEQAAKLKEGKSVNGQSCTVNGSGDIS